MLASLDCCGCLLYMCICILRVQPEYREMTHSSYAYYYYYYYYYYYQSMHPS